MKEIFDRHRQDFNEIRRLCLICHGLDLSGDMIFTNSTYENQNASTTNIYQSTLSGYLLNLAIAIRVNIYQQSLGDHKDFYIDHCGGIYDDKDLIIGSLTIKDVCDKIIHANSFTKQAQPPDEFGMCKLCVQMKGTHNKKGWVMDLSIQLFTEAVLNYLDKLEYESA